jgi:TRAP-type transport system periplasmic protein
MISTSIKGGKTMKKLLFPVILIVLISLIVTVSSSPAIGKTIRLKFAHDMPPKSPITPGWNWFASELDRQTNGQVKIDFYPAQSLFKSTEAINSLIAGVADIAATTISANQKVFSNNRVFTLPSVFFPDTSAGHLARNKAATQMYEKYPVLNNEFKQFKLLLWQTTPAYTIVSRNRKVAVPDDLKGLKVGSLGLDMAIVKLAGGTPVNMIPPEFYTNMDKGVIDAAMAAFFMLPYGLPLEEIASYFLGYGFGQNSFVVLMNLNSWNSLPSDVQKLFAELAPEVVSRSDKSYLDAVEKGKQVVKAKGRTITSLTADQRQLWTNAVQPMDQVWLDQAKADGVTNAADILNALKALCAQAWK